MARVASCRSPRPRRYRRWLVAPLSGLAFCLAGPLAGAADAPIDVTAALTHYRCYICHADDEPLTGPAFADIASHYRGKRDAVFKVARDIRTGVRSGGPWHMPPHPEVSREEARAMARYILSLADKAPRLQAIDRK